MSTETGPQDLHRIGTPLKVSGATVALAPAELVGVAQPGASAVTLGSDGLKSGALIFEAPAFVSGFDDVAVVREAIEQRRRHLGDRRTRSAIRRKQGWS